MALGNFRITPTLCCPCVRGAAGAAEVCAELHCCSAERLSLWAAMQSVGLLWPCPLVVPPQGMSGTVVAGPRAFSPVVVARFQSASLQVLEVGILHRKWMCGYSLGERQGEAEGLLQAECRCLYYAAFGLTPSYQSSSALANIHAREVLEKAPKFIRAV